MLSNITNFPNGASVFGVPIFGSAFIPGGTCYFVDANNGDGTTGKSPDQAFATLETAIDAATASKNDYIFVMPGHTENLSPTAAAAGLTIDKAGVHIIGLGHGSLRPTFTCVALAADTSVDGIEATANDVEIANIIIAATTTGNVTAQLNVAAANFLMRECHVKAGAEDVVACVTLPATALDATFQNNIFEVTANGAGSAIKIEGAAAVNLRIMDNLFNGGNDTNAWDEGAIASAVANLNGFYLRNIFSFGVGLDLNAASTGVIAYNLFGEGTLGSMLDPGSCMCFENYEADAVDETGRIFPTTAAS